MMDEPVLCNGADDSDDGEAVLQRAEMINHALNSSALDQSTTSPAHPVAAALQHYEQKGSGSNNNDAYDKATMWSTSEKEVLVLAWKSCTKSALERTHLSFERCALSLLGMAITILKLRYNSNDEDLNDADNDDNSTTFTTTPAAAITSGNSDNDDEGMDQPQNDFDVYMAGAIFYFR
jgi:hypothetical protein